VWKNSSCVLSGPVAALELQRGRVLDRVDHLVHEFLGRHEEDPGRRTHRAHVVADRVHEVGLSEPHAAVYEERVVALAGALGHRLADGVRELVAAPDDERVEGVVLAEIALVANGKRGARSKFTRGLGGLGAHVERDSDRPLGHRGDRVLDQRAVVLVQPINVELVWDLEHKGGAVELERSEIPEPGLVGLAR